MLLSIRKMAVLPKDGYACVPCVEQGNGCVPREIFVLFREIIVFPREMLVVPKQMVVSQGRYLCFLGK
jgi:hypothetical protein